MAPPGAGGDEFPPTRLSPTLYYPPKRRTGDAADDEAHRHARHKRARYAQHSQYANPVAYKAVDEPFLCHPPIHQPHPHPRYPSPHPLLLSPDPAGAAAPAMERTASGHSIRPDPTERCGSTELLEDAEAAQRVRDHLATFRRRNPDSKHERILRSIINPRPRRHRHRPHHHHHHHPANNHQEAAAASATQDEEGYPLDNAALESIFSAANEIFFNGRLSQRVMWDWTGGPDDSHARHRDGGHSHNNNHHHNDDDDNDHRVIGTTALRRATTRGFETLVVLSSTVLRDARFSRRLLISTFLHELIHCYLFICCGFRARGCGGHTPGFRAIAEVIDEWAGRESRLYLSRVEADLELFRIVGGGPPPAVAASMPARSAGAPGQAQQGRWEDGNARRVNVYACSGMAAEQEHDREHGYEHGHVHGYGTTGPGCQEAVVQQHGTGTQDGIFYRYLDDRDGGSGSGSNVWSRQRPAVRPVYVYTGDDPAASYVYANTTSQRP